MKPRKTAVIALATVTVLAGTALTALSTGVPADAVADRAARGPKPAPRILPFAAKPGPSKARVAKRPEKVAVTAFADGCDRTYGTIAQCVPVSFPKLAKGESKCAWLAARGFPPLAVHGKDRQKLDSNQDGVACGPGDRK
ncbi:hypothetical protein [Acrocarpospora catenulata]|uniref:hypothetical protein n=1 Tax=Acrocarpospora catenulata TaxID=2836182 RepID=UPI001BD93B77|nr:hypothetical protein [Acrocarpospora catenulata]